MSPTMSSTTSSLILPNARIASISSISKRPICCYFFEDNNENIQLQENVDNNNKDIDQQGETATELQGSDDNNTILG